VKTEAFLTHDKVCLRCFGRRSAKERIGRMGLMGRWRWWTLCWTDAN
jgi:hypothetical protein